MQNDIEKRFLIYFIIPMGVSLSVFFVIAYLINSRIYDMPDLNALNMIKYIIISTFNFFDVKLSFSINVPKELYNYMCAYLNWTGGSKILANYYPAIFNELPTKYIYKISMYWFYFSAVSSLIFSFCCCASYDKEKMKKQTHLRGTQKVNSQELTKVINKKVEKNNRGIAIGTMCLPRDIETRHFMILGTTGTGKSYLLMNMIQEIKARSKMVILDRKGEFYANFADSKKDILWNPYDNRHANWSMFNEFKISKSLDHIPEELKDLADSLFSVSASNKNAHFYQAASDVFCSGMCYLALNSMTTNKDIKSFFISGGDQIYAALKTLPEGLRDGIGHLGKDGTGEHAEGIISCIMERGKDFGCFVDKDGAFSVRDWMNNNEAENLYISTAGPNDTRYLSIVTMILDIVGREVKNMNEVKASRLVIVIDELASLPPLKTLSFLLNEGRSKGVCVILANQTFQKIQDIYGVTGAKNIFANCVTKFIFKLPEPSDAEYISKAIGEQEVIRSLKSNNQTSRGIFASQGDSKGTTISEQITKEPIFLASQIENLAKYHLIAMIPDAPIAEIEMPKLSFNKYNSCYDPISKDEISAKEIADFVKAQELTKLKQDEDYMSPEKQKVESQEENFFKPFM